MNIKTLDLTDVRAIGSAQLHFQPGFNVIAGANGVGKTTILDALAVCCSAVARRAVRLRKYGTYFRDDDIRLGARALQTECEFVSRSAEFKLSVLRSRDVALAKEMEEWSRATSTEIDNPTMEVFLGEVPAKGDDETPESRLLTVLYSTARSVATEREPRKSSATGNVAAAFAGALSVRRGLELGLFAAWMRVQLALGPVRADAQRKLSALENAVVRFLPGYSNLRPAQEGEGKSLLIDYDGRSLPVSWLSDGERGLLSLVLDLTRRLAHANPDMVDPAANAEAVVLIDELELHLHPAWQRRVIANLTATFPRCQFIATTHSPQVIGEIERDRIQVMSDGDVYSPTHSFGVDSSRVLEEVMGARARNSEVQELLTRISARIDEERYDDARELLARLVKRVGEHDPEVTRGQTLLEFLEDK
ncbi:MAG: AAA family ATPase [Gammaproteobacteria bacterium]|nr:AAA family ATPase [Gammaproteobacteria bacterium]